MKRSTINDIMGAADDMIRQYGFVLPPFAYWTPDQFRAKRDIAARVI
jgi:D-lyxose ketol-isomerase